MTDFALLMAFPIAIGLGWLTAWIALRKGYNPMLWALLGFLMACVALPAILLAPSRDGAEGLMPGTKICSDCAETIKAAAKVCHYCGKEQPRSNECPSCGLKNFEKATECRMCQTSLD